MIITIAEKKDVNDVCHLLDMARNWHIVNTPEVWPSFSPESILRDIDDGRVYILFDGKESLATLTVTESDPLIWDNSDVPAFYLHKLASLRSRAGQGIGKVLIDWAKEHAMAHRKKYLRLDTWATNTGLKRYYESQGFSYLRTVSFPKDSPLPSHYRGASMNLFEMPV